MEDSGNNSIVLTVQRLSTVSEKKVKSQVFRLSIFSIIVTKGGLAKSVKARV